MSDQGTPNTNQIDLETEEAQKLFASAFEATIKGETIKPDTPTEVPAQEPAPVAAEPASTPETPVVVEAKETPPPAQAKEDVPAKVAEERKYNVPDWAKDLPDNIKENLSKELQEKLYYEQKYKSDAGRQSALQRKLYEARKEAEALRARLAKPLDPAIVAAAKEDEAKQLADWNKLQEADPDLAKAFEARLKLESDKHKTDLKTQLEATVNPLIQHNQEAYEDEQRRLLSEQVPNFAEVVASPVYDRWLRTKASPGVRNLALNSLDHQDALTVLRVYSQPDQGPAVYNDMVRAGELPAPPAPAPAPAAQAPASNTSHADSVAKSREQRLQAAPVVPSTPNPIGVPTQALANYKTVGGAIDIDDPTVVAAFEDAYKKNLRVR